MKTLRPFLWLSVLGLSIFGATAAVPGIDIIQNGSFESIVDGGVAFPPWHFDPGFTAVINEPRRAADGGNFVGLPGFMWQDMATELGQAYRVSYSERGDFSGGETSVLYVYWQGQFVQSHLAFGGSPWSAHQFEFRAQSTVTRLMFAQASWTAGGVGWPSVDAVKVITIVPEPGALALVGVGFSIVALGRRSRSS